MDSQFIYFLIAAIQTIEFLAGWASGNNKFEIRIYTIAIFISNILQTVVLLLILIFFTFIYYKCDYNEILVWFMPKLNKMAIFFALTLCLLSLNFVKKMMMKTKDKIMTGSTIITI